MEGDQDYISQLPNSILSNIFSSLKTREVVRTSVLSTRWRYVWTTPINLVFDADNMLEEKDYYHSNLHHISVEERYIITMKRCINFVYSVNHFLSQLEEHHRVEKLKVYFTFSDNMFGNVLDHWIRFAVAREVEEIDLCLLEENYFGAPNNSELYVFSSDLLVHNGETEGFRSFLKCLRLAHCILAPSRSTFSCFSRVTSLDFKKVDLVSTENIQNLLRNCHNLEWLSFSKCHNMIYLKIEHPFCLKLKCLNVNDCPQLKAIELKDINLETLEYKGCSIEFLFCSAPRLRTVFTYLSDCSTRDSEVWPLLMLPIDLPQLETLFLECNYHYFMGGLMKEKRLPPFPNLRHLIILKMAIIQQDLSWMATILKAYPTLQRLELHVRGYIYIDENLMKAEWPPSCPHNHLKEVVISGIQGYIHEILIAVYLLNNATALEKMIIDPRPRVYIGDGKWSLSEVCEGWTSTVRERLQKHLTQKVCLPAKLLIL
ncbi:hypothetical protein L6164_020759 [Bauhinia variegata]|uniref:Uncharacterized protein n=1 Tax=Bauhinia variegata TaxID=167791 RepID=A0ACB9MWC6_BAUVA|nr:hypothetical protein L6164_020759 [Bauhinia variegata]